MEKSDASAAYLYDTCHVSKKLLNSLKNYYCLVCLYATVTWSEWQKLNINLLAFLFQPFIRIIYYS